MSLTEINIYSDGGSRNNPGNAACAFVAISSNGDILHEEASFLGIATNNIAEYEGVILAIQWLKNNLVTYFKITFHLDSQLVVNQLNGIYRIKDLALKQKADLINAFIKTLNHQQVKFVHIPRSLNIRADYLVNNCLDQN